ncbi:MAG: hypothetical protein ACM3SR_10005 [Ignavibacteriales bacterium]
MHLANEVKTVADMILQKLYDLSVGNPLICQRLDLLFIELNNDAPHYIQDSLFDSGLGYAVDRKWIKYGETANEVLLTVDGRIEVLTRRVLLGIGRELTW